jgi:ankyrin repeat protein
LTRATQTIISCIESEDLQFLYSALFSPSIPYDAPPTRYPLSVPLLINRPDEKTGWSPIHYCAGSERPNVHILDALYCAGADVALFTRDEEITALHILAMQACLPDRSAGVEAYQCRLAELYDFTVHLISDLRAPLAARDENDETCIHVAAERGMCMELLMIFLECDVTGAVREMRNSRG